MGEVFAGFVCGYILALAATPLIAAILARLRTDSLLVARLVPAEAHVAPLIVVLHGGLMVACTMAGIILGMVLLAMDDGGHALASRNLAFTLFVFGLVMAVAAPLAIVLRRFRAQVAAAGLLVLLLFGWLMPYVAAWSKFGTS